MKKKEIKTNLPEFAHECMDRTFVSMDAFNNYVSDHPYMKVNKKARKQALKVQKEMAKLYDMVGKDACK